MELALIGLGKMGLNMATRLVRGGHKVVGYARTKESVEAAIEKIIDRTEYPKYGLLYTPGLVINNKLVCGGRIPTEAEVLTWVADALN